MRVIVAAAGNGERWNNHRNIPKHFINIEGQPLLNRIVSQFRRYTEDIVIIGKDDRYIIEGSVLEYPLEGEFYDFGKIYSSSHVWSNHKTIIVFGDVYFTDEAVETIVNDTNNYRFFMRTGPSIITGKKHKEIFALSFDSSMNQIIKQNIEDLINKKYMGGAGAWQLYLYMHNEKITWNMKKMLSSGGYTEINDWTDDFDTPQDIQRWERQRFKFGAK